MQDTCIGGCLSTSHGQAISAIIVSFVTKLVWGKENLVRTVCVYVKIPRKSHSSIKYHIPCNERKVCVSVNYTVYFNRLSTVNAC